MVVVVVGKHYLILKGVVINKYNIILIYNIMFNINKRDLTINLINIEPLELKDVIKENYFREKSLKKYIYRNVLDIHTVRKKNLGEKMLKNILSNCEFSINGSIDILDILNLFHV